MARPRKCRGGEEVAGTELWISFGSAQAPLWPCLFVSVKLGKSSSGIEPQWLLESA